MKQNHQRLNIRFWLIAVLCQLEIVRMSKFSVDVVPRRIRATMTMRKGKFQESSIFY